MKYSHQLKKQTSIKEHRVVYLSALASTTLTACGGGDGDAGSSLTPSDGASLPQYLFDSTQTSRSLILNQVDSEKVPNRSSGEAHGAVDIDHNGKLDFFFFETSTRDGTLPIDNDILIFSNEGELSFKPHFTIGTINGWPAAISSPDFSVANGPIKSSWVQDVVVADFNGDGHDDIFFSGHGREYADGFSGPWGQLSNNPEFLNNYPGDRIQILFSGPVPYLVEVSSERSFWHSARVGDFDTDGDLDIVATNFGKTNIYWNNGQGSFLEDMGPLELHFSGIGEFYYNSAAVDVADVTGDGQVDLIVGPQPYSFFNSPQHPNGIVIFSYDITSESWLRVGDAPFPLYSSHVDVAVSETSHVSVDKINTADFDGDGDVDIIVKLQTTDEDFMALSAAVLGVDADGYFGTVIYENTGGGNFDIVHFEPKGYKMPGDGADFFDFDKDGMPDIVYTGWPGLSNDITDIFESVFINRGSLGFVQLKDAYDLTLVIQDSYFQGEAVGENYSISYFGVQEIEDEVVVFLNKYGPWKGENDLIFLDVSVA